ncbi:hypothetical protein [Moorena sp. SIO3I6]|nr:hypothetical protein [Moorena sp. SIO3I6]
MRKKSRDWPTATLRERRSQSNISNVNFSIYLNIRQVLILK